MRKARESPPREIWQFPNFRIVNAVVVHSAPGLSVMPKQVKETSPTALPHDEGSDAHGCYRIHMGDTYPALWGRAISDGLLKKC